MHSALEVLGICTAYFLLRLWLWGRSKRKAEWWRTYLAQREEERERKL